MRFRYSLVRVWIAGSFVFPSHATLIFMGNPDCGKISPAPKGASDFEELSASLKRCPDTTRSFLRSQPRYSSFSRCQNHVSAEADLAPDAIALDRRLRLSADHRPLVRRNPLQHRPERSRHSTKIFEHFF